MKSTDPKNLADLPIEVLFSIFNYLDGDATSYINLLTVNKKISYFFSEYSAYLCKKKFFFEPQGIESAKLYLIAKRICNEDKMLSKEKKEKANRFLQEAKSYLEKRIANSNINDQTAYLFYLIGKLYLMMGDKQGLNFFEKAIEYFYLPAMIDLGSKYVYGYPEPFESKLSGGATIVEIPEKIIIPNREESIKIFELAIQQKNGEAAFILGKIFEAGQKILYEMDDYAREYRYGTIKQNKEMAQYYFSIARELGYDCNVVLNLNKLRT